MLRRTLPKRWPRTISCLCPYPPTRTGHLRTHACRTCGRGTSVLRVHSVRRPKPKLQRLCPSVEQQSQALPRRQPALGPLRLRSLLSAALANRSLALLHFAQQRPRSHGVRLPLRRVCIHLAFQSIVKLRLYRHFESSRCSLSKIPCAIFGWHDPPQLVSACTLAASHRTPTRMG